MDLKRRACVGAFAAGLVLTGCVSSRSTPTDAVTSAPTPPPVSTAAPRHSDWSDAIVYFVIVDRFADGDPANNVDVDVTKPGHFHGGDLVGLTERLDEIADLGVTAIWITPVVDNIDGFVTGAGFPDYGYHGYWAEDFHALDERFGTEAELKALVDACHARGIAVLLDVVYNHTGYEAGYIEDPRFQPWLRVYGECGDDDLTMCVGGLPDWRTEIPEVADWLLDTHIPLAERVGLDGFRLDTVKHIEHAFWQRHRALTRDRLGSGFFLLGEVWGGDPDVLDPYFEGDEMDAGFDFGFAGSVAAWVQGRGRTIAFDRYLERRHRTRDGFHLAHYLSSHDVETLPSVLGGDWALYRLAVAVQMTTVGIPIMYYGEEVGRLGGDWPDNRSDHPWGDLGVAPGAGLERDDDLRAFVTEMVGIRRAHPALSRGSYTGLSTDGDVLVFAREHAGAETVVVALNRGREATSVTVDAPAAWVGRTVRDHVAVEELTVDSDGRLGLDMPPLSVRVMTAQ
jgi:alpha-amylase